MRPTRRSVRVAHSRASVRTAPRDITTEHPTTTTSRRRTTHKSPHRAAHKQTPHKQTRHRPSHKKTALDKTLRRLYYDPDSPAAYSGVNSLWRAVRDQGISKAQVTAWLSGESTYTLHRPARRHFQRNRVIVGGIDSQWQADLVDMQSLAKHNDGYRYLLTCIDVFSKYAWVVPIRTKTGVQLIDAFRTLFATGRQPLYLQTDEGTEFLNKGFQQFLQRNDVFYFHTWNETKASVVERFNRTFKGRMYKYFTAQNTRRYIDVVQALVTGYNKAYHRSIGRAPTQVTVDQQDVIRQRLYGGVSPPQKPDRFQVGDQVRISKVKGLFEKAYLPNWSTEIFRVKERHRRRPVVYTLEDLNGEVLAGTFYEVELQHVTTTPEDVYQVEEILKTEHRRGKPFHWVKWLGWPSSFNSWIPATALIRI